MPLTLDEMAKTKRTPTLDEMAAPPERPIDMMPYVLNLSAGEYKKIEDQLPDDVRDRFRQIIEMADDPDEERRRLGNILYFSNLFNEPPTKIQLYIDEMIETYKFDPMKEGPKLIQEAAKHGHSQLELRIVKGLAGIAKIESEVGGRLRTWFWDKLGRDKPDYQKRMDRALGEWSDMMLNAIEVYQREHPEEAVRLPLQAGYLETLKTYITNPAVLVQSLIESSGMMLEGILGTTIGGPGGGITLMAYPIIGETYADARKEETEVLPALAQATFTGVGEAVIEQWTLSRKLGLTKNIRKLISDGLPRLMWEGGKAFFRGTAEEGSQEFNRNFWRWVFTNRSQKWSENVAQSMGAGGIMEAVMAGGFSTVGMIGTPVSNQDKIARVEKIREIFENAELSDEHRAEINAELDKVIREIGDGVYEMTEEEVKAKQREIINDVVPGAIKEEVKPAEVVKPTEIETLAKELEESLNLTPERALEVASKKLAYDAMKAAEIVEKPPVRPVEAIIPEKPPTVPIRVEKPTPILKAKEEISPIVEPELTKQEQADIAKLEAEIEEPFVMERVKDVGFVIKEKATGKEVAVIAKRKEAKAKLAEFIESERKIRITRRVPKLLTDTATIEKLITEARALKEGLKKAAQAARKAYTIGKAEGIAKVKVHYQDLKLRERARKELKGRIEKAVKTIRKSVPASVDFFYREAIENLQAGIDPSFRTKKTLRQREKTREFLQRKPEALKDMPVKLLKKLAQKSVGEYTIAEVEQIAEEIERLKKQGKLKRKLKQVQKARKLEKATARIVETITKGEPIKSEKEPIVYSTTKEGFIKTAWEKTKAWTWRPSRIFDMLDGVRDFAGEAHRIFIDKVNQATNAKLRMEDKRKDAGKAKRKELSITFKDLTQTREIAGVKYTVDEMIGVYNANKNRLAKLAIMYGNNINEKTIAEIIDNLTDAEKTWGDYIVRDYDENYNRLRNEVIEVENRDMGYEENYTPIRRTEIDYTTHTEEIIDAILRKEALRKAYAEHGFTIKRKEVPVEFQKPIRLNATSVWLSQVAKQEQYIHLANLVKDLHKIANDKEFRTAIEQQFGKEFNKVIRNYVDRVANPNIYKSYNSLENLSRRLRQHTAIAYLAYNLLTMTKQIPSVFLYLQDAGPTHLLSSAMEFATNPMKMVDMVREKDPQVKHRAIERELEELKIQRPDIYSRIITKFGRAGMEGIYLFDAIARTIGWNAVYQKALHNGMSEVEAVRLAQNSTLRTQPAAAAKDVAQLYATTEVANWLTMFTNQLNQIYNIATYDFRGYLKNEDYRKAFLSLTGLGITALMIWIITKRRLPKSPEDFAEAAGEQAINAVPLIGKDIMTGKKGWGERGIPAFTLPRVGAKAINRIVEGKFSDSDIDDIAEGVGTWFGIPYIGPKRVIKMITTGEIKELVGGEPIEKKKRKPARPIKRR